MICTHSWISFLRSLINFMIISPPYNLPSNHQWGLVQLTSKLSGQHLVLSMPDRNAGIVDIYCPSLFVEWYAQNVLEQHKFSNVNCFTLLDESCHFSKTCTIKITGFQLEDLGLMDLYRMHMTRKFKDFPRKRTIISYFITL